jgi:hypothetical protein
MRWRKTSRIRQEGFRKAIAFRNLGMASSVLVILQYGSGHSKASGVLGYRSSSLFLC